MPLRLHGPTLSLSLFVVACGQVLGLEEAYVDESLNESSTTETSTGGSGGTGAKNSNGGATGGAATATGNAPGGTATSAASSSTTGKMSTATSNTSGGGEANESTTSGGDPPTLCESYCATIGEYCVSDNLQYRDDEQCLRVCTAFSQGNVGDEDQNSVACRLKYAGKARYAAGTELAAYCRQAGPGGDDRCGSNCEGLCSIMMLACTQQEASPYYYESVDACLSDCATLPEVDYYYGIADGNSVQCRIFHAASAAMYDASEHCEHAFGVTLCEE